MKAETKGGKTLIDSILELIDLCTIYVRQQVKSVVDQGIAMPIRSAGRKAALFMLAFTLFSLASIFVAVGLFLALASLIGYVLAYLAIGAVLIIAGLMIWQQSKHSKG